MAMKTVLIISTFIAFSSRGIHSLVVDIHDSVLTAVRSTHNWDIGADLPLNVLSIDLILPNALSNLSINFLKIYSSGQETKKLPNLQPDIFNRTNARMLMVTNVYFPVRPNPFVNLKSVEFLHLSDNDFNSFPIDFFADFPNVTDFEWKQYNACQTISPILFSKMNKELKILMMEDRITAIEPNAFDRFESLTTLVLHGELGALRQDMFNGLHSLKRLDLSSCGISAIDAHTFSGLPLTELNLEKNFLESIPLEFVHGLSDLKLNDNRIRRIWGPIFKNNSRAGSLDLSNNRIKKISSRAFDSLHLDSLILRNNSLKVLRKNTFQGLFGLMTLDVSFNRLRKISNQSFSGFTRLTHLRLHHNELRVIENGTFQNIGFITFLDLSSNQINYLHPVMIRPPMSGFSVVLDLRNNSLEVLHVNTFPSPIRVSKLILSFNRLREISGEAFRGLADVRLLYLDHNQIRVIRRGTFDYFDDLWYLDLAYNQINHIESHAFYGSSINSLNLRNNLLKVLQKDMFLGLAMLKDLNLAGNRLQEISGDAFHNIRGVAELYLNDNEIKVISNGTLAHFDDVDTLDLSNNQIDHIEPGAFTGSHMATLNLSNNSLEDLQRNRHPDFTIRDLYLSSNKFQEIPTELFSDDGLSGDLYLNNNQIKVIRAGTLEKFSGRYLDLSNNQISHIEKGRLRLQKAMQKVNLLNNPVTHIPT